MVHTFQSVRFKLSTLTQIIVGNIFGLFNSNIYKISVINNDMRLRYTLVLFSFFSSV